MNSLAVKDLFFESAREWVCDSYVLDTRFLAVRVGNELRIIDASFVALPFLSNEDAKDFFVDTGSLVAGQSVTFPISKTDLLDRLTKAVNGVIVFGDTELKLDRGVGFEYYSELLHRDNWFSDLHLQVIGTQLAGYSALEATNIDQALRVSTPPFDGLSDLCGWLHLADGRLSSRASALNIRVLPPVDLRLDQSRLKSNQLFLTFEAHPKLDPSRVSVAIKEFPGKGVISRRQIGDQINWGEVTTERQLGTASLILDNADSALTMLTLSGRTIRRQWIIDPDKAINPRYVATQLFDKELKQLKQSLFDSSDSVRFEQGIASLLFMLGFAPAIQVETQAPDILLASPGGRLAIVECTLKTADFQAKLGKLVDRRNAVIKQLESTGHNLRVDAFLVCGSPKTQIAFRDDDLTQRQITLLTREDIEQAFYRLRTPRNPDEMLDETARRLSERLSIFEK